MREFLISLEARLNYFYYYIITGDSILTGILFAVKKKRRILLKSLNYFYCHFIVNDLIVEFYYVEFLSE